MNRKGVSLLEVVVAVVILSILGGLVATAVVSSYRLVVRTRTLPNTYYGAQGALEEDLEALRVLVTEKFRIQNELMNVPPAEMDPELVKRLAAVNSELSTYETETVTLFGKTIGIYDIEVGYTDVRAQRMALKSGLADAQRLERPVPIIDDVEITVVGEHKANDTYQSVGKSVNAVVSYNSKNEEYYYADLYQWYVATGDFHTANYIEEAGYEEVLYGTVYAQFPQNFTLIPSATQPTLTIDTAYEGKFIICMVTPLSIGGKMGSPVLSNSIYISGLPKLQTGHYEMLIEPSITSIEYDATGRVPLSEIISRLPQNSKLYSLGSSYPYVDLNGAATDTALSASTTGDGNYSRFIAFDVGKTMRSAGTTTSGQTIVYAVVRNNESLPVNFIYAGASSVGLNTCVRKTNGNGDTGWQVIEVEIPSGVTFDVGNAVIDVAELLVTSNATMGEREKIWAYLLEKYHIKM